MNEGMISVGKMMMNDCVQVLGLMEKMRQDERAQQQAGAEMKEEAKRYAEKYQEANEVLKLRNTEKATLVKEKQEQEKVKKALEQQVHELSQGREDLELKVRKLCEVNEF